MRLAVMSLLVATVLFVELAKTDDLVVGNVGGNLIYMEKVNLVAIPFIQRTKNVFFNSDKNQTIKGIQAIDADNSTASVKVTAGGTGQTMTNVRLRSERGKPLNFQVMIFG